MNPNLVHPAGFWKAADRRELRSAALKAPLDPKTGSAAATQGIDDLTDPDFGKSNFAGPKYWLRAFPRILPRPPADHGQIFLNGQPLFKNSAELAGRFRMLRDEHHPAGFAVQAGYNSETSTVLDFIGQQTLESAEQCRLGLTVRRVDNQRCGLVDNDPIVRFVHYLEVGVHLQIHDGKKKPETRNEPLV